MTNKMDKVTKFKKIRVVFVFDPQFITHKHEFFIVYFLFLKQNLQTQNKTES